MHTRTIICISITWVTPMLAMLSIDLLLIAVGAIIFGMLGCIVYPRYVASKNRPKTIVAENSTTLAAA